MAKFNQESFDSLYAELAVTLRVDGWVTEQEVPPAAYLHVSKPNWGDEKMNGIHLETYVLSQQLNNKAALVALHCEKGCPFQESFMQRFT